MTNTTNTPTVVLVHGGFADASFWAPVIEELQSSDVPVLAPPNPLRGLAHDAEYIASFVNQIDGPVLLVGHSYGGAVISVAGASTPNAVGLVYVAAFALDEGESFGEIFGRFGDTPLVGAVRPSHYPLAGGETAVELTIAPELYREAFAADLSEDVTRVLAVSQRPFAAIFEDRAARPRGRRCRHGQSSRPPTTRSRPDAERHMAQRAGAQTDRGRRVALDRALAAQGRRRPHPNRGQRHRRRRRRQLTESPTGGEANASWMLMRRSHCHDRRHGLLGAGDEAAEPRGRRGRPRAAGRGEPTDAVVRAVRSVPMGMADEEHRQRDDRRDERDDRGHRDQRNDHHDREDRQRRADEEREQRDDRQLGSTERLGGHEADPGQLLLGPLDARAGDVGVHAAISTRSACAHRGCRRPGIRAAAVRESDRSRWEVGAHSVLRR